MKKMYSEKSLIKERANLNGMANTYSHPLPSIRVRQNVKYKNLSADTSAAANGKNVNISSSVLLSSLASFFDVFLSSLHKTYARLLEASISCNFYIYGAKSFFICSLLHVSIYVLLYNIVHVTSYVWLWWSSSVGANKRMAVDVFPKEKRSHAMSVVVCRACIS